MNSGLFKHLKAKLGVLPSARPRPNASNQRIAVTGFRNGVSGQDFLFQPAELVDYLELGRDLLVEMRPVGPRETQLAQRIIDVNWRLNRLSAVINNLEIASILEASQHDHSSDTHTHATMSQSHAWKRDCQSPSSLFDRMRQFDTSVSRQLSNLYLELERVQKNRLRESEDSFTLEECAAYHWYSVSLDHARLPQTNRGPALLVATAKSSSAGSDGNG